MSQENVEVVQRAIAALIRRDLDAAVGESDPDVVVDWSRSAGLEAGIFHGHQATRDFWSTLLEMWDRIIVLPDEFIERGEYVVVPNRTLLRGRNGVRVEARAAFVVRVRNGRIIEWRLYQATAEALKAVGLEE
jgi:ketosteroid isomerase-like protein